jgi:hypothetical protein
LQFLKPALVIDLIFKLNLIMTRLPDPLKVVKNELHLPF